MDTHDLAHEMADQACDFGKFDLALAVLEMAERNGRKGALSSLRSANRIMNLKERLGLLKPGRGKILNRAF